MVSWKKPLLIVLLSIKGKYQIILTACLKLQRMFIELNLMVTNLGTLYLDVVVCTNVQNTRSCWAHRIICRSDYCAIAFHQGRSISPLFGWFCVKVTNQRHFLLMPGFDSLQRTISRWSSRRLWWWRPVSTPTLWRTTEVTYGEQGHLSQTRSLPNNTTLHLKTRAHKKIAHRKFLWEK